MAGRGHSIKCLFYFLTVFASWPHTSVTFPKVLPSGRDRQSSWYSPGWPQASQSIISCVRFRKKWIYCLTAAALRGKSLLSVALEGCHYCWALNIIIRGYKLHCCQGWSGCRKGIIIFVQSSLAARCNIWIILSMRHMTETWISVKFQLHIRSSVLAANKVLWYIWLNPSYL